MRPWDDDGNRIIFSTNYASPYYNDPDSIYAKESLVIWYRDGMQRFIRRKGTEVWKPY